MDLEHTLAALRHDLQLAREFIGPWDRFYDGVVVPHCHAAIGEPAANPRLERCLESVARHLFREQPDPVRGATFSYLAEHRFWHGSGRLGDRFAICFYFEDPGVGLVGFLGASQAELRLARVHVRDQPRPTTWTRRASAADCN